MSVPSTFNRPRSLHLLTGSSLGHASVSSSPLSSHAQREPWGYESPSGEYYERICSVISLFDFSSSDPDHLSFRQHETLEIVRQEQSGWWAAVRSDGSGLGWIPASYVRALSDDAAQRVSDGRERTTMSEYSTSPESVRSAPPLSGRVVKTPSSCTPFSDNEPSDMTEVRLSSGWSDPLLVTEPPPEPTISEIEDGHRDSPLNFNSWFRSPTTSSPSTIIPPFPQMLKPLRLDKSLPASPDVPNTPGSAGAEPKISTHGRNSSDSVLGLIRAQNSDQSSTLVSPLDVPSSPLSYPFQPHARSRPGKVFQLTGDDNAQAFHNAKQAQANLPWYLKHRHSEEEIKLDFDGTVKAGTLPALVEHLVADPLRASQQEIFRRAFLVTFRTFATSTEVFDLLVAQYESDVPPDLSEEEFDQWKREKLRPSQRRVLTILAMWLEEYDLLNQDPEVAPKLQDFLRLIVSPNTLASTARHILKSLERLTFAEPFSTEAVVVSSKKRKKARKVEILELVRMDPLELAQHLSLFESNLYRKIRSQECFLWSKTKEGDTVKNIQAFCATHDKLVDWVKCSILEVPAVGKRANMVDFWIRVAEKCRSLNNFSSMSSIVAALSSVLISRLHFTWVTASREYILEPLRKIIHPASNYGYYRSVLEAVEGPCIPFVGPFLKNIVYTQDQHADNVVVQSATTPDRQFTLVHFVKRQKWYDITLQMLRFQSKPYHIHEIPEMTNFIVGQMEKAVGIGERWYLQRSDELQHAELVHADIRRGLEAAGF